MVPLIFAMDFCFSTTKDIVSVYKHTSIHGGGTTDNRVVRPTPLSVLTLTVYTLSGGDVFSSYLICNSALVHLVQSFNNTASQVGFGALSSQQATISVLQRSSSPRWFFSMTPSCWIFKSRFTPSVCQRKTDFNSFASAFRVGVAGAAGGGDSSQALYLRIDLPRGRSVN